MTKKILSIFMLVSVLTFFTANLSSCKKDETKETNDDGTPGAVDVIIIGSWKVNKVTLKGADVTSTYLSAQKSFDMTFNSNGTCAVKRGGANLPGNYDFNKDKTQLTITYYNDEIERFQIIKSTTTTLVMKMTSGTENHEFTFKKI
ncbi:MAG: DUF5004 domain-containing protein [Bacteroidia bacterium]|nr:DUF5004 domain-containing protein [Bacteroidia bacterium]